MTDSPICPHCQNEYANAGVMRRHAATCPANIALHDAIRAAITDPQRPGVARSQEAYRSIRVLHGAPPLDALVTHYGSWGAACADYGLQIMRSADRALHKSRGKPRAAGRANCPHCGGDYTAKMLALHIASCARNPALYDVIRATLESADLPGMAVGEEEYSQRRRGTRAPTKVGLRTCGATWAEVCAAFGLRYLNAPALREMRVLAQVAQEEEAARAALEMERVAGYGLKVSRVREVGGRVYCELR